MPTFYLEYVMFLSEKVLYDQVADVEFFALEILIISISFFGEEQGWMCESSKGQSYEHFTSINYDCRVVIWAILLVIMTLEL